ncbi:MAG: hypothetical protein AB7I27_07615 [Bacteriovoracaceae bacterium]
MIQFEVVQSPDLNAKSVFQFYKNQVYLGKNSGDLHIQDLKLQGLHLLIEVIQNDLIIHPQKNVEHYLINGKRTTTVRKIKVNDVIGLGNTLIKILSFENTPLLSKKAILDRKLSDLAIKNSPKMGLIEKLTKLMK